MTSMKRYFANKWLTAEETYKEPDPKFWKGRMIDFVQMIRNEVPPLPPNADGGLYVGSPGIAYLFYRLFKSPMFSSQSKEFISHGMEYIYTAERYVASHSVIRHPTDYYGLLLDQGGLHVIAAVSYIAQG